MKNKKHLTILQNLTIDIINQYQLEQVDEDVLFHALIAYDNLGIGNLLSNFKINKQTLIDESSRILSEKKKGDFGGKFSTESQEVLQEAICFATEREIDVCLMVVFRSFIELEHGELSKFLVDSFDKAKMIDFCDKYLDNSLSSEFFLEEGELAEENEDFVNSILNSMFSDGGKINLNPYEEDEILSSFGENLNIKASKGHFDNLIQFNDVIDELATILCKQKKPNAILIGPAGGGKTSNVELLAKKIHDGTAPELLLDKVIYTVNLSDMVAGTQYRGQFEQRLKNFTDRAKKCSNLILFIDEIHTLIGAGGTRDNSLDASNILKPALARGEISCIGATTISEYNRTIKKDTALDRRFERIIVSPPSSFKMQEILPTIISYYEKFHNTQYSKEFVSDLIPMCEKYMPNRFYPDKAIDVIDYCGAMAKVDFWKVPEEINELVKIAEETERQEDIQKYEEKIQEWGDKAIFEKSQVSLATLRMFFAKKVNFLYQEENIKALSTHLNHAMFGQNKAVNKFIKDLTTSSLGIQALRPHRSPSVFCIHSEKNNGRSYFCSTVADFIKMHNGIVLEYNGIELDSVDKVISADLDGNSLAQKVSISPNCVVIIDDFHKINEKECHIAFRQIFKEGRITKRDGEISDFSNVVFIISTPSVESSTLGFSTGENPRDQALINKEITEFVSHQIKLEDFNQESMHKIAQDALLKIKRNLAEKDIEFDVSDSCVAEVAKVSVYDKNSIKRLQEEVNKILKDKNLI